MKEWLSIQGEFKNDKNVIKFIGGDAPYKDIQTNEMKDGSKYGILLFDENFFNGTIEMSLEFDNLCEGDEAEIIYNYIGDTNFSCTGITNTFFKYEDKNFNGNWCFNKCVGQTTLEKGKNIY